MSESGAPATLITEPFTIDRLERVRQIVRWAAAKVGLPLTRAERFILAVSEAAANAIQHGGGRGRLELLHRDGTALIARVIDRGPGMGTVGPAQRPPTSAVRGRGRWIMSEYCDSVDYRTSSAGTTVELCVNLTHTDG